MTPISRGALAIGNKLVLGAKTFRRGLVSSLDFGKQTIGRTAEKINANNQRIKTEKKRQRRLDQQIEETKDRKEKEKLIEAKKAASPVGRMVKNVLRKPLEGFWKLIQAWAIANLPGIIDEIKKFVLKVRIFGAAVKRAVLEVGGVFKGLTKIASAVVRNLAEFDFSDKSGRIKEAKQDLDDSMDEIRANFEEAQNVWGREEEELEEILRRLESGETMKDAVAAIEAGAGVNLEPQNPAVGTQPQQSGERGPSRLAPIHRQALDKISQYESASAGGYNAMNQGTVPDRKGQKPKSGPSKQIIGKNLTDMTVGEVLAAQDKSLANDEGFIHAAGRYQFIGNTLPSVVRAAGVPLNAKFSPEIQDQLAVVLMQQRGAAPWLADSRTGLLKDKAGIDLIEKAGKTPLLAEPQAAPAAETQQPQAPAGAFLTDQLFAKDFNTKDYSAPSPIIRTSDRGMRWGRMHNGVDFGTGGQTGWYCALLLDGKVTYVGYDAGGGNMVFITSGGIEYCFMHLARYAAGIRQGASYKAGQPIGEVGNTGKGTGIHLHFETRKPGTGSGGSFNPDPYVKYVTFGRLKTRTVASANNTSGTSEARAAEVASAAESKRTGGTQTKNKTTVVTQKEVVMVT